MQPTPEEKGVRDELRVLSDVVGRDGGGREDRDAGQLDETARAVLKNDLVKGNNVLLEMRCLICRLICGIVGFNDRAYITSELGTLSKMGVRL